MEYEIILYLRVSILKWKYEVILLKIGYGSKNLEDIGRYYVTKKEGHTKLHRDYVITSHTLLHHTCFIWTSTMKVHTITKS